MVHCVRFWDTFEREGNFCGVSKSTVRDFEAYLDFVRELGTYGADREDCFRLFPSSAYTQSKIPGLKRDSPIRKHVVEKILSHIASKKHVSGRTARSFIGYNYLTDEEKEINFKPNHFRGVKRGEDRTLKTIFTSKYADPHNQTSPNTTDNTITALIRRINGVSNTGQKHILNAIISAGYADDEYGAFCIALKWAADRLEQEGHLKLSRGVGAAA